MKQSGKQKVNFLWTRILYTKRDCLYYYLLEDDSIYEYCTNGVNPHFLCEGICPFFFSKDSYNEMMEERGRWK